MYEEYFGIIQQSGLANNIDFNDFDRFLQEINPTVSEYKNKQHVCKKGEAITAYGLVLKGHLLIYDQKDNGKRLLVSTMHPGEVIGSVDIPCGRSVWPFDYITNNNCTVMHIPAAKLFSATQNLFVSQTQLNFNLARLAAVEGSNFFMSRYIVNARSIREKIMNFINANLEDGSDTLTIQLTREEWADYLYIPKTSLMRELRNMKDDGIIEVSKKKIKLLENEPDLD